MREGGCGSQSVVYTPDLAPGAGTATGGANGPEAVSFWITGASLLTTFCWRKAWSEIGAESWTEPM